MLTASHSALHSASHSALHSTSLPALPPSIPPELHPAPCTPLFTLLCVALHPPSTPSCPSPCAPTPFHTAHFHRTSLLPRIPLAKSLHPSHSIFLPSANFPPIRVSPPSVSLSQVPPADFLVRKKARFTHDMTFFRHDVCGKRFNAHGASHNMEMSSVKTMWQRSPGGGGTSGGMVAHDLVNGCQATA